ncbi:hypothetical protein GJ496_010520 [Pomphorhynchus laevis]|nr:hypothetical protein GJ496_010520 [Pomphorhynchus laevis]
MSEKEYGIDFEKYVDPTSHDTPLPVVIRGLGRSSLITSKRGFNEEYHPMLIGKLSSDDFLHIVRMVNIIIRNSYTNYCQRMLFGITCCCCSCGMSLIPLLQRTTRARKSIENVLKTENARLYQKLGLEWKLEYRLSPTGQYFEYVLLIAFIPPLNMFTLDPL